MLNTVEYYDNQGVIVSIFRDVLTYMVSADDKLVYSDRPLYHGLLLNREQLKQIIDNKHLFDTGLVNAAYLLLNVCDSVTLTPED